MAGTGSSPLPWLGTPPTRSGSDSVGQHGTAERTTSKREAVPDGRAAQTRIFGLENYTVSSHNARTIPYETVSFRSFANGLLRTQVPTSLADSVYFTAPMRPLQTRIPINSDTDKVDVSPSSLGEGGIGFSRAAACLGGKPGVDITGLVRKQITFLFG